MEVGSGLLSKYGTEPLLVPFSGVAHALDLITDIRVIQRVYSTSGVLVDTVILEKDDPYIPVANAVFDVTFARETSLEESKIVFQNGS